MKRIFFFLSVALLAVSCWQGHSNRFKVDVDKALKKRVDVRKLYSEATVIPLRCPEETTVGQEGKVVLEVAADRFFLLDKEKNEILVFNGTGDYVASIRSEEKIIDLSAYQDQVLDVLTAGAITEYDIEDCSLLDTYPIRDNDVILTRIAKVDDDTIDMSGYLDGTAYDCGYLFDRSDIYTVPRPTANVVTLTYVPAVEMKNCRFFRSDGEVYGFLSRSGQIDRYSGDDFIFPAYGWNFGKRYPVFTNAQMMGERLFLAFELDGKDCVLVYNLDKGKYIVVESDTFPLGVIYSGSNYYCCRSSRLNGDLPRPDGEDGLVIIRYSL